MPQQQQQQNWPIEVQKRLSGVDYPLDRKTAENKLEGVSAGEVPINKAFEMMQWPVNSPSDLEHQLKMGLEGRQVPEDRELPSVKGGEHSRGGRR